MSQIINYLSNELNAARDALDDVEAASAAFLAIGPEHYADAITKAKKRLGKVSVARSTYLDEVEGLRGEIEDLREQMKPIRIEAFAKERVKHYQKMAYMLDEAIRDAVEALSGVTDMSKVQSARERLQKALRDRTALSRSQS